MGLIDILLPHLGMFLDIGNAIFFIVNFPQLIAAYRNRKDLKGLSSIMLLGYAVATIFFTIGNFLAGGRIASVLNAVSIAVYAAQLYWKYKYRK